MKEIYRYELLTQRYLYSEDLVFLCRGGRCIPDWGHVRRETGASAVGSRVIPHMTAHMGIILSAIGVNVSDTSEQTAQTNG